VFGALFLRDAFLFVIVSACTYTNDPYFCLLQAACIEVLDHFVVDISLMYSVYLNEVEEKKSVMHCHWFALVFRKLFVALNL
jgi:hypothetical protein